MQATSWKSLNEKKNKVHKQKGLNVRLLWDDDDFKTLKIVHFVSLFALHQIKTLCAESTVCFFMAGMI